MTTRAYLCRTILQRTTRTPAPCYSDTGSPQDPNPNRCLPACPLRWQQWGRVRQAKNDSSGPRDLAGRAL